jgi:hypothetical protein
MTKDTDGLIFGQIFPELMNTDEPEPTKEKAASDAACGNFFSIQVSQLYLGAAAPCGFGAGGVVAGFAAGVVGRAAAGLAAGAGTPDCEL